MNKKILFLILIGVLLIPTLVLGQAAAPAAGAGGKTVDGIATALKGTFVTVGGSVVFIGWIFAGILWLTSAGKPEKMETAKKAIIACAIGTLLIILAGAAGDIKDVIENAFGL